MIPRAQKHAAAALLALAATACTPAVAQASSGGAGLSPSASPASAPGTSIGASISPLIGNGDATVSASGAGITVSTTAGAVLRNQLTFTGSVPASDAGETIEIERLGHETNWQWAPTAESTVAPDGAFSATWVTNHIGEFSIRAILETAGAQAATASPTLSVIVYLPAVATWYGPGFFGHRLACGGKLRRTTLGVASRTLPCGTKVALMYQGRTITVPVVDRGPYANDANWDLTEATADALGMAETETIGAASLPAPPAAAETGS